MGWFQFSLLPSGGSLIEVFDDHSNCCVFSLHHLLCSSSYPCVSMMINCHEPTTYDQLLDMPEFSACSELFVRARWHHFLTTLQGHDNAVSLKFSLGFYGHIDKVGSLVFQVTKESVAQAIWLPRIEDRWFKNFKLSLKDYDYVFKP